MAITAAEVWRDYETDGVPSSGSHKVKKNNARSWGAWVEGIIAAFTGSGGLIYASKALLDADLAHGANSMAWVLGDATVANNGVYRKIGASGVGSWTRVSDLPFSFIIASDAGAGTANAIQATTSLPVSGSALVWTNIFEANTASPVTISFNGGSALTIKTNSGNDVSVGGLAAGMIVLGIVSGSTFRLVSDQASAAVLAGAEAAKDAAEAAKIDAEAAQAGAETAQAAAEAAAAGVNLPPVAPNRMLVDNAAGTVRESKTFEEVRGLLDAVTTKLYGSSSLARSLPARFGDVVDMREFLDGTGAAGTDVANNAGLAALIAYITANPGKTVVGHKGDVYKISGTTQYIWPAGCKLRMDSARFQWNGTFGTSASTLFQFNSKADVEALEIEILTGSTFRRLVDFMDQNNVSDLLIYAQAQIANEGSLPLLDFAVRYRGQAPKVTRSKIINIDKAHFVYGDGGDGVPTLGARLFGLEAESFVTGINLRNQRDTRNISPSVKIRSANAAGTPGHNGIVHEGVFEYYLADAHVMDSGEHGIRFGGTRFAEQASGLITVNGAAIYRAGQSGLKFFTGAVNGRFKRVNVSNVNVVDCQYEPATPAELPGFNDEGFLLQQIEQGIFQGLNVSKQSSITGFSSDCCVYVSGATDLVIMGLRGDSPRRNLIRISEWDDGAGSAPVETLANNGVTIIGAYGNNIGEDGIYFDHPTQSVRDIVTSSHMIGSGAAGFYAVRFNGAAARFAQPCLFEDKSRNFAAGQFNVPGSANAKTRNIFGTTY